MTTATISARGATSRSKPLSLEALKQMVKRQLPGAVYRCKGVVYTADAPNRRAVLQVVGRRSDVSLIDDWKRSAAEVANRRDRPGRIDRRSRAEAKLRCMHCGFVITDACEIAL